jgi:hypothetical protein
VSDWRPLVDGGLRDRALEAIERLAASVRAKEPRDSMLGSGDAGVALLHAYLAEAFPDEIHGQAAERSVQRAATAIAETELPPSLWGGFTGIAWVIDHLQTRFFPGDDADDANEEIDAALAGALSDGRWEGDYDLVFGVGGIGLYGLERCRRPSGRALLELAIARLSELAIVQPDGIAWRTDTDSLGGDARGGLNCGVAHGVPGLFTLLAGAAAADVQAGEAERLLDGAVRWLLASELPPDAGSAFTYYLTDGKPRPPARAAWCYGDPGVALALHAAARAIGRRDWEERALAIARRAAARPPESTGVTDAGLCHGAAGLAHLYSRLHQATGDPPLGDAARFWLDRAIALPSPSEPGLLEGEAGVALALTAAIGEFAPSWDRALGISI